MEINFAQRIGRLNNLHGLGMAAEQRLHELIWQPGLIKDCAFAICERLACKHLRRELPGRGLILDERHLRAVLAEYQEHYNTARPHQGIAQNIPDDEPDAPRATVTDFGTQQIRRKPVLGGLINEYARAA